MLCNISQNAMGHPPGGGGGTQPGPSWGGGYPGRGGYPAGGYPGGVPRSGTPLARSGGGVPCQGGTLLGGRYPGQVPPQPGQEGGTLPGGYPARGGTQVRYPPGQVRRGGGTQLGQHREYLLHGRRYASCVHAGGLSCFTTMFALSNGSEELPLLSVLFSTVIGRLTVTSRTLLGSFGHSITLPSPFLVSFHIF